MKNKTDYIWQNGKFVPWENATTHVLTHSLHYGAATFEGIRCYETTKGPAIFRLDDHLRRLFYSASTINMKIPYSMEELKAASIELVKKNNMTECYIRPIAYYGYGKMGVNPEGAPVDIAIACWSWNNYIPHTMVDMKTNKYIRIPNVSSIADAKLSGNYLNSILGILQLQGTPYHETLFLDLDGHIAEGAAENIFFVKNDILYTPKLGSILAGITRDTIMQIAKQIDISVHAGNIHLDDAYLANEAFLTGTAIEVMPIRSIDDCVIGNGKPGLITEQIKQAYLDIVRGNNKNFEHFLTFC